MQENTRLADRADIGECCGQYMQDNTRLADRADIGECCGQCMQDNTRLAERADIGECFKFMGGHLHLSLMTDTPYLQTVALKHRYREQRILLLTVGS